MYQTHSRAKSGVLLGVFGVVMPRARLGTTPRIGVLSGALYRELRLGVGVPARDGEPARKRGSLGGASGIVWSSTPCSMSTSSEDGKCKGDDMLNVAGAWWELRTKTRL